MNASRSTDWRALVAGAAILSAGLAAFSGWKNSPTGQLVWDGQTWRWESVAYQAGVSEQKLFVIADLQNLLLLRLENQAHVSLWLWVERKALPERWLDLRRAVYSPHKAVSESHKSDFKYAQTLDSTKVQP